MSYWIVIACNHNGAARKSGMRNKLFRQYDNKDDAEQEAKRLSVKHSGALFGVFQMQFLVKSVQVEAPIDKVAITTIV